MKSYVQDNGCIGVPTDDSLETVEMEVCYRASAFLRFDQEIITFFYSFSGHNTLSGVALSISNVGQIDSERFPISFLRKSLIYTNKLYSVSK